MKKTIFTSILFSVFIFGLSAPAWAQAPKSTLKTLHDYLNHLQTFQANFVQTQPDEELFQLNKSIGYVVLQRPGKLMWVYQKPEHQEIISDSLNLWVYEPEIDQVTVRPLTSVQSDFPLRWLIYSEKIEDNFNIIPERVNKGISWYNLVPKDNTFFQSLEVGIANNQLVQLWMYQSPDNVTKVVFSDIRQNQKIADNQFDFEPPQGVDVVGQRVESLK